MVSIDVHTRHTSGDSASNTEATVVGTIGGEKDGRVGSRRKAGPRGLVSAAPRQVIRGAKWQVSVDWLTIVVPGMHAREALRRVSEYLGHHEPCSGGCFQPVGASWESGARLFYDPRGGGLGVLQLNSRALSVLFERTDWRSFYKSLADLQARITRFDIALDFFKWKTDLLAAAVRSCKDGELCGARTFKEIREHGLYGETGRTLYLGRRGKDGSGRFGRLYDKGQETGTAPARAWLRWEVEFTGERACILAHALLEVNDVDRALVAECLGAFQFREVTGHAHLDRRPPVSWFRDLIAVTSGAVSRVKVSRHPTEFESYRRWVREACIPGFRSIAQNLGMSLDSFIAACAGDVEAATGVRYATLALEFQRRDEALSSLADALRLPSLQAERIKACGA